MLRIHSLETFWTHEGPGIRLVIFTQGCQFRCLYCENPDTIPHDGGKEVSYDELLDRVEREKTYFGKTWGVTISWGEPLLHAKQIIPFFKELKKRWVHTAIDTNGFVRNSDVEELIKYTDLFLPDIKHINNHWHKKITSQPNKNTLKFIKHLESIGKKYRIRYVLVQGFSDQDEYIHELGQWLANHTHIERLEILPYHTLGKHKREKMWRNYELGELKHTTKQQAQKAQAIFLEYIKNVYIR